MEVTMVSRWRGVLAPIVAVALLSGCAASAPALTVDGREISDDEIDFRIDALRESVDNQVSQGLIDPATGAGTLTDLVVDAAVHDKVLFRLASENGVIPYDDFSGMLAEMARENASREEAVKRGEIVYGLTNFTPKEFYSRAVTNMRSQLVQQLGAPGGPLEVSDDAVRAAFEADPSAWVAGVAQYDVEVVEIPQADLEDQSCSAVVLGADSNRAVTLCPGAQTARTILDGGQDLPAGSPDGLLLAAAQSIEVGQTAAPVPLTQGAALVHLLERRVDPESALSTYRERIRSQLIEKALNALIEEKARGAIVSVDRNRIDSLITKDLK